MDIIFSNLLPGSVITITTTSGNIIGPATFTEFDPVTLIVTLEEDTTLSPASVSITKISVNSVESISFIV